MEKDILKNFTKYQKTWPEPVCRHGSKPKGKITNTVGLERFSNKDKFIRRHRSIGGNSRTAPRTRSEQQTLPSRGVPSIRVNKPQIAEDGSKVTNQPTILDDSGPARRIRPGSGTGGNKNGSKNSLHLAGSSRSRLADSATPNSILRSYETKHNYGPLYQLRELPKHQSDISEGKKNNWFWQRDYRLWRKHFKQPVLGDLSSSDGEEENDRPRAKPHPDLYGVFNSVDLHKQLLEKGATDIQRLVRGWLVRRQLVRLREKASELSLPWDEGIKEYLRVRTKIRARLHVLRNDPELDLHDVKAFLEQKKDFEDVFKRMGTLAEDGRTLPTRDLREFFTACCLNPSDREINSAFQSVFGGSPRAEVVLLVDRSADIGPLAVKSHLGLAKSIVTSMSQLTDISRVTLVPFDESADHVITMENGQIPGRNIDAMLKSIEEIRLGCGERNAHLALQTLRTCFKNSAPGATKIGIAITGGISADPEKTKSESMSLRTENINIFTIGVGHDGAHQDISPPGNAYLVSGLGAWKRTSEDTLEELISKSKFWNQTKTTAPLHDSCRPLTMEEVLTILWTIYPPQGIAARHSRRSTWLHPIVDGDEPSPALEDAMKRETPLTACIRLMVQARIARDGFMVLPTDGPSGSERVHDVETAVNTFQNYLESGRLSHLLT